MREVSQTDEDWIFAASCAEIDSNTMSEDNTRIPSH